MMKPMTAEQRKLAEANHDLVGAFLRENKLSEEQFYDVVIFGYLCAVQQYCENPNLKKKYSLATLAWKKMKRELVHYYNYLGSDKRSYHTVSLHESICEGSDLCWEDVLHDDGDILKDLQMELILHELAARLPKREMRIIRRKINGDKMHDIAKAERLTFRDINTLLAGTYDTVIEVLLG
ncbi:MAG: hypothetical protein IJY82_01960 [Oscillospiraceae bacterium]|nr:hypothetical protein [Oscillospiraceae bacterium]